MEPIDADALRTRGMREVAVALFVRAAEAAWDQAVRQIEEGGKSAPRERPLIVLHAAHEIIDPQTVRAAIGENGALGTVTATSPGALRDALARHLAERFGTA